MGRTLRGRPFAQTPGFDHGSDNVGPWRMLITRPLDDGLPTWVPRLLGMIVATILGTLAVLWVLGKVQSLLITIVLSLFISFALEPAVFYLAKRGWRRGAATAPCLCRGGYSQAAVRSAHASSPRDRGG